MTTTALASGAAFGLCLAGMAALALVMARHGEQAGFGSGRPRVLRIPVHVPVHVPMRIAGALLLAAGLRACVVGWGATVGVVVWFGWLTVAAWSVVALLSWRPRWTAPVAALAAAAAIPMLVSASTQ